MHIVDLLEGTGSGPLWGTESDDLNATLLAWPAGHEVAEHTNADLDVLVIVLQGSITLAVDGEPHPLASDQALLIEKGRSRAIKAGPAGARYLSVHRRRGPLQIQR